VFNFILVPKSKLFEITGTGLNTSAALPVTQPTINLKKQKIHFYDIVAAKKSTHTQTCKSGG